MRLTRWPGLQLVRNHVDAFERSAVRIGSHGRSRFRVAKSWERLGMQQRPTRGSGISSRYNSHDYLADPWFLNGGGFVILPPSFDSFTSVYVPATSSDRFQANALTSLHAGDHASPVWRPALPTPRCCAPGSFAIRARGVYKGVEMVVMSPAFPSPSSAAPVDSVFCLFVVVLGRTVNRTLVLPDSCRKFSLLSLPRFLLSGLRSVW